MNEKKKAHIVAAVAYLKNYMATYDQQFGYADYSEQTYIDDVLYGLGASLGEQYKWAGGFDDFKQRLLAHLSGAERRGEATPTAERGADHSKAEA